MCIIAQLCFDKNSLFNYLLENKADWVDISPIPHHYSCKTHKDTYGEVGFLLITHVFSILPFPDYLQDVQLGGKQRYPFIWY